MKKKVFLIIINTYIFFSCFAKNMNINKNYELMQFEIIDNDKIIAKLPFSRFQGYKKTNNKIFFIDVYKTKITEYGELCFFDEEKNNLFYTGVYSGSQFLILEDLNLLVTSSLLESTSEFDIEDIFGLSSEIKKYPLNITIFEFDSYKKLKEYNFKELLKYNEYENLYSDFKLINNNQLKISYGIYDTSQEINIGIIDLISLEYKNNKN